jgi:hypothetical protein
MAPFLPCSGGTRSRPGPMTSLGWGLNGKVHCAIEPPDLSVDDQLLPAPQSGRLVVEDASQHSSHGRFASFRCRWPPPYVMVRRTVKGRGTAPSTITGRASAPVTVSRALLVRAVNVSVINVSATDAPAQVWGPAPNGT